MAFSIKNKYIKLILTLVCLAFGACGPDDPVVNVGEVTGLRPLYRPAEEAKKIEMQPPRPLQNPGKIYVSGNWLLINEVGKGLHVIDNTDPASPEKVSFISIPGNIDMAVKGQVLYADNYTDLVAIDISNPGNIKVSSRVENAFGNQLRYPLQTNVYFECVDDSKGLVIGWEEVTLTNPECYR